MMKIQSYHQVLILRLKFGNRKIKKFGIVFKQLRIIKNMFIICQ